MRVRLGGRRGTAGILAAVLVFAMLFTVGTSYLIFQQAQSASYARSLLDAGLRAQGQRTEDLVVTTSLEADGDVGYFANNTSTVAANMTGVLVVSSAGALLRCDGVGFPTGSGCSNSSPALSLVVSPDMGSPTVDTGYLYASGSTVTLKVLTARGNVFNATYPMTGSASRSAGSVTVNLDNLKWVQLLPQASSLVQDKYVSNCNSASCSAAFGSSVTAGNILVDAIGWGGQSPPSGVPTDTLGDSFTLGASSSAVVPATTSVVQDRYASNCNAASCGLAFSSSVTAGHELVYAVGWPNQSPPSAPTDTLGDSFTLGASDSVTVTPPSASLVQRNYLSNCNSATCSLAFSSSVSAGDELVFGLGWPVTQNDYYVPVTITNNQGSSTPNPFQQKVTWNPSSYSAYEASDLGNVRFCADTACNTPLYAWLESCSGTCGPAATLATAWVKLTSAIPGSGGSATIYMVFQPTTTDFDGNYWGEAPNLSSTYGQYDNGANVFTQYGGKSWSSFTTVEGTWSTANGYLQQTATTGSYNGGPAALIEGSSYPASGSYAIDTAFSYTTQAYARVGIVAVAGLSGGDAYGYRFIGQQSSNGAGFLSFLNDFVSWRATGTYGGSTGTSYTMEVLDNAGTWSGTFFSGYGTGGSSLTTMAATGYTSNNYAGSSSGYVGVSAGYYSSGSGGSVAANPASFQWFIMRALPPNAVMPGASLGTLSPGTASPTSVTDTLGDAFTLAVSQTVTSGSATYASFIWYSAASASGADTVTATFASAVQGTASAYELAGYSLSGAVTSTGGSSGGSTAAAVTSFSPGAASFVVANVETASTSTKYTPGSGYTTVATGSSGCDTTDAAQGCSEYQAGLGSSTTAPFTLGASTPWVESAMSLTPLTATTYYSYMWYATAKSTGADTVAATFGSAVAGSISLYELSGVTATGLLSSTGSSSSSQSSTAVGSITPTSGAVVIGNAEGSSTTYTAGSGYTLSGTCNTVGGCGEYEVGTGSATTVPASISPVAPWVESALAFAPTTTTYYSYIWYATASTSGADTITATFGSTVAGSVSIYEIAGYTTSGALSSTGSSSAGSTTASVTSFTPNADSFMVGNAEGASGSTTFTAGTGFTLDGSCSSVEGCSQYDAGGGGSASTVPITLSSSTPWAEAAMSFSTPFNQQSGIQVGGYPTMGVPSGASLAWEVTFTDIDSQHRSITIWPQTELSIGLSEFNTSLNEYDYNQDHYYIIDSLNAGSTTVNAYTSTTGKYITLAYGVPTTLYFAATVALGSTTQAFQTNVLPPFEAYFALTGVFSDGTLYGETVPYPYGIITTANAHTTPTAGSTGTTVTVTCTSPCNFNANAKAMVGWINSAGQLTQLTTFTATSTGNIPTGVTFQVPSVAAGYYTIEVTDYVNSVFSTFQHT